MVMDGSGDKSAGDSFEDPNDKDDKDKDEDDDIYGDDEDPCGLHETCL